MERLPLRVPVSGPGTPETAGWGAGLAARLEALSGGSNRISDGYKVGAWIFLVLAVVAWQFFATAAAGLYFSGFLLRREGL
jgi:hypothetical protein